MDIKVNGQNIFENEYEMLKIYFKIINVLLNNYELSYFDESQKYFIFSKRDEYDLNIYVTELGSEIRILTTHIKQEAKYVDVYKDEFLKNPRPYLKVLTDWKESKY